MITLKENTDLLKWFDEQTVPTGIIHQCNCFHTMGSGIARQIKARYPEAYLADTQTSHGDERKLGTFSFTLVKDSQHHYVYNLYSQFAYGRQRRQTSYDAMVDGFENIIDHAKSLGLKQLGVPFKIGSALGGGSWQIVDAIIQEKFHDAGIDLFICQYDPPMQSNTSSVS